MDTRSNRSNSKGLPCMGVGDIVAWKISVGLRRFGLQWRCHRDCGGFQVQNRNRPSSQLDDQRSIWKRLWVRSERAWNLKWWKNLFGIFVFDIEINDIFRSSRSGVRPSVSNFVFSISFLITWPTKLKLRRVILDIGAQSRSVPDFAVSSQRALWGRAFEIFNFYLFFYVAEWVEILQNDTR